MNNFFPPPVQQSSLFNQGQPPQEMTSGSASLFGLNKGGPPQQFHQQQSISPQKPQHQQQKPFQNKKPTTSAPFAQNKGAPAPNAQASSKFTKWGAAQPGQQQQQHQQQMNQQQPNKGQWQNKSQVNQSSQNSSSLQPKKNVPSYLVNKANYSAGPKSLNSSFTNSSPGQQNKSSNFQPFNKQNQAALPIQLQNQNQNFVKQSSGGKWGQPDQPSIQQSFQQPGFNQPQQQQKHSSQMSGASSSQSKFMDKQQMPTIYSQSMGQQQQKSKFPPQALQVQTNQQHVSKYSQDQQYPPKQQYQQYGKDQGGYLQQDKNQKPPYQQKQFQSITSPEKYGAPKPLSIQKNPQSAQQQQPYSSQKSGGSIPPKKQLPVQNDDDDYGDEDYGDEMADGMSGGSGMIKPQEMQQKAIELMNKLQGSKKMCTFFLKDQCKNGAQCRFSHDEGIKKEIQGQLQSMLKVAPPKQALMIQNQPPQANDFQKKTFEKPLTKAFEASKNMDDGDMDQEDDIGEDQYLEEEEEEEYNDEDYGDEEEKEQDDKVVDEVDAYQSIAQKNKGKNLNALLSANHSEEVKVEPLPFVKKPSQNKSLQKVASKQSLGVPQGVVQKKILGGISKSVPQSKATKTFISQNEPQDSQEFKFGTQIAINPDDVKTRLDLILAQFDQIQEDAEKVIIPEKAELLSMCSIDEIKQRVEEHSMNQFEMYSNGSGYEELAMKAFQRSAADRIMNAKENIRPGQVLYLCAKYLRNVVVDQDLLGPGESTFKYGNPKTQVHTFTEMYNYVKDRQRSIAQDFIILNNLTDKCLIMALQDLSRFLIIAYHDGFNKTDFSVYYNNIALTKNLGTLKNCYQAVRIKYPIDSNERQILLNNEVEFMSYLIILSSLDPTQVQEDIKKFDSSLNGIFYEAVKIHSAIVTEDTFTYFKMLGKTNYLFSCCMISFLNDMRLYSVNNFSRGIKDQKISIDFIQKMLKFHSSQDTTRFLNSIGLEVNSGFVNLNDRQNKDDWQENFKNYKQRYPLEFMDQLRGNTSRMTLMMFGNDDKEIQKFKEKFPEYALEARKEQIHIKYPEYKKKELSVKPQAQIIQQNIEPIIEPKAPEVEVKPVELTEEEKKEIEEAEARRKEEELNRIRIQQEKQAEKERKEAEQREYERKRAHKARVTNSVYKLSDLYDKVQKYHKKGIGFAKLKKYQEIIGSQIAKIKERQNKYFEDQLSDLMEYTQSHYRPKPFSVEAKYMIKTSLKHVGSMKIGPIQFSQILNDVFSKQEGVLKLSFISGRQNVSKQQANFSNANQRTQISSIENCIVQFFTDYKESIKINSQNLIVYDNSISKELDYQFTHYSLDQHKSHLDYFVGSSMVVLFTKTKDALRDLKVLEGQLKKYCPFSRIKLLLILYQKDTSIEELAENKITQQLRKYKESQIISSLQICFLTLTSLSKAKYLSENDKTLLPMIFTSLEQPLNETVKEAKLAVKTVLESPLDQIEDHEMIMSPGLSREDGVETPKSVHYALHTIFDLSITEIKRILQYGFQRGGINNDFEKQLERFIFEELKIDKSRIKTEVDAFNFWVLVSQILLKDVFDKLKLAQEYLFLNQTQTTNVSVEFQSMRNSLAFLDSFMAIQPVRTPQLDEESASLKQFAPYHLSYLLSTSILQAFSDSPYTNEKTLLDQQFSGINDLISQQIENFLSSYALEPFEKDQMMTKGIFYFKVMIDSLVQVLKDKEDEYSVHVYDSLVGECKIKPINGLDIEEIKNQLVASQEEESVSIQILKAKYPEDFEKKQKKQFRFNKDLQTSSIGHYINLDEVDDLPGTHLLERIDVNEMNEEFLKRTQESIEYRRQLQELDSELMTSMNLKGSGPLTIEQQFKEYDYEMKAKQQSKDNQQSCTLYGQTSEEGSYDCFNKNKKRLFNENENLFSDNYEIMTTDFLENKRMKIDMVIKGYDTIINEIDELLKRENFDIKNKEASYDDKIKSLD